MKTIFHLPTVTIGIPALNEGKNIGALLESLVVQEEKGFVIEHIVVASDGSTDNTVHVAQSIHDSRIVVMEGHERRGKAVRQNEIISHCNSDILVFLDADIKLASARFITHLVEPILENRADFTSGSIAPLEPKGLVDAVLAHIMRVKARVYRTFRDGDSVYSCYGPARAFSRNAYQRLTFLKMAAEDAFSYLQMKQIGMRFVSCSEAVFYVRCPRTLVDHKKQSVRFLRSHLELAQVFGEGVVKDAYVLPVTVSFKAILYAFVSSPFLSIMYVGIFLYMKIQAMLTHESQFLWAEPTTSKELV